MDTVQLPVFERMRLAARLAQAGIAWLRHDTHYPTPVPENPRFMSAWEAVSLIGDGDVVAASGLGAHQRASILYWAIRERFDRSGHPSGLTVVNVGGHGGRGRAPGTLEELGRPGLCTRLITSHFETFHSMLTLAEAGQCELQCLPLGVMTLLFEALGAGRSSLRSRAGVGTFLDPRVGPGSPITPSETQLVSVDRSQLRYRMPPIDVAVFNAPAADRAGNIYAANAAILGESLELARAARRNRGKVLVNVGCLVEEGSAARILPAEAVDGIVFHPDTEQTGGVFHRDPWTVFTPHGEESMADGLARVRFINSLAPVLRHRSPADAALLRVASAVLLAAVPRGSQVSVGTGLPEEIPAILFENNLLQRFTFMVETGVVGGLPASGLYFGAALRPREIIPSARLFRRCLDRLDATCLGALEFDMAGRVNVSRRGRALRDYVGPGGFIDFATHAECIVFVCSWMRGGHIALDQHGFRITRHGVPKLVEGVEEITFDAAPAVRAGRRVYFVTHAGVFELTRNGLALRLRMPGIDVTRDILSFVPAGLRLPPDGVVPPVPLSLLTGQGLDWQPLRKHLRASDVGPRRGRSPRSRVRHRRPGLPRR